MDVLFCKWDEPQLRALRARGVAVHLLLDRPDVTYIDMPQDLLDDMASVRQVETLDSLDELNAIVVDLGLSGVHIDTVVSHSELSQFGAGFLLARLGIDPEAPERVSRTRDKRLMKECVRRSGVPVADFASLTTEADRERTDEVARRLGFPLIVKPVNGVASISTARVDSAEQLHKEVANWQFGMGIISRQLVAEQFIDGDEYHIDAVWDKGQPVFFSVSKYHDPRLVSEDSGRLNGSCTLPEQLHAAFYARCREMHDRVNRALGITDGVTHLEFFHVLADDTFYFSEVGTRMPGGYIPENLEQRYGVSLFDVWLDQMSGRPWQPPEESDCPYPYVGWINLRPERSGIIRSFPPKEELLRDPHVLKVEALRDIGSRVTLGHTSVWCFMVVAGADSHEEFLDIGRAIKASHRVEVDADEVGGAE